MKNVVRLPKPPSLRRYAAQWTGELQLKIQECEKEGEKVPDNFYNKYKKNDVRDRLGAMYNSICCYCETQVGVAEFGHIEHRKPKKIYPESAFDWNNLHLACTRCNSYKGDKYSEEYPILDAVNDQITEHMKYHITIRGILWHPKTRRGETTERHTKLNEDLPRNKRTETFLGVMELIEQVNEGPDIPGNKLIRDELLAMSNGIYGSVIAYAMQKFLK